MEERTYANLKNGLVHNCIVFNPSGLTDKTCDSEADGVPIPVIMPANYVSGVC